VVAANFDANQFALPFMRKLLETFRETVNLGVLYQGEVVYLQILESTRSMRMSAQPGQRNPVHCTALGKALIAYLPEADLQAIVALRGLPALTPRTITTLEQLQAELARVRSRGYAIDDIENEKGVRCVAAPIFNHQDEVIAAISLSGPADRMSYTQMEVMGKELLAGTRAISQRLGYRGR
jgi:DNA-binding IclR family transcriptional regulator